MALRRFFVGGNWKSNNTVEQTKDIVANVYNKLQFNPTKVDVIAAPVFLHIPYVQQNLTTPVSVSTQNTSATQYGAYTGEIAPNAVKDFGLNWTILGHSERRAIYGEDSQLVADKTLLALNSGLNVIACVGETLQDREAGNTNAVVQSQLEPIRQALTEEQWQNIVIAYEPVWAIGTGVVATPEQAQDAHNFIRGYLNSSVSSNVANQTRIIYGGSVTDKNSGDLIQQIDIDGFLVGGASLKPAFIDIVNSCNNA